jgi:putative Holliday junction resolvase
MRTFGIDFGEKRIGLAIATGKIALPFGVVFNNRQLLFKLKRLCQKEEIGEMVIGLPLTLDGREGRMAEKVKNFGKTIQEEIGVRVKFWDERLTTKEARQKFRTNKGEDARAAALVLQSYLDTLN